MYCNFPPEPPGAPPPPVARQLGAKLRSAQIPAQSALSSLFPDVRYAPNRLDAETP